MPPGNGLWLFTSFIFLFLSGFFTLLKEAYGDLNMVKLDNMKEENILSDKEYEKLKNIVEDFDKAEGSFIVLDYMSNALSASALAYIGFYLFNVAGMLIALLISSILILIFGEELPNEISISKGDSLAIKYSGLTNFIMKFLSPLHKFIKNTALFIAKISRDDSIVEEPKIREDELINAVNLSKEEGLLDNEEYGLIEKVFKFRDSYAKDVMTPRTEVVAIDINSKPEEIVSVFVEEGYSRIPVYEEDIDSIIGILHVKDLIKVMLDKNEFKDVRSILRKPLYTFEYQKTDDLFKIMRMKRTTFAIVLDEYGGNVGIITLEDLVEEIVGDIEDEYDEEDDEIIKLSDSEFILDGATKLDDFNEKLSLDLDSEEVDTIGGFVVEKFDKIPKKGETLVFENLTFTILEMDKNRIDKLKLKISSQKI